MKTILLLLLTSISFSSWAACRDSVVLVHGNTSQPASWDNTYSKLKLEGYLDAEIYRPSWGNSVCAACNNHQGAEELPVRQALSEAVAQSCTGKIDVIGHSMGATLAAQQIVKLNLANQVDTFIGIAGAFRGLWSCGWYPFNVPTSTCGYYGLSVNSPFLNNIKGKSLATEVYSFKSWFDQINCATGVCTVGGVHTSQILGENSSFNFNEGHFGLQTDTAELQFHLIQ